MSERLNRPSNSEPQREQAESKRRRNRIIFGGIILATLPFYCAGIILYFLAPAGVDAVPTNTRTPTSDTSVVTEVQITREPTNTVIATFTTAPLQPTSTSGLGVPPTPIPRFTSTPTRTNTPPFTNTPIPTNTPAATNTPVPTSTPAITDTPIPFGDS